MRTLFALLLIYFLTGTLQITGDHTFCNIKNGTPVVNDDITYECILSAENGLSELMIEDSEDQDDETTAILLPHSTSGIFQNNICWLKSGSTHQLQKSLLLYYTNLPPPAFRM